MGLKIKWLDRLKLQSFHKKSIGVLFLRGIGVVLFFALTLFLTNLFDPELVGKYDYSRSLLVFLGTLALFGMQQSIIYYSGYLSAHKSLGYLKSIYKKMVLMVTVIALLLNIGLVLVIKSPLEDWLGLSIDDITIYTFPAIFFYGITMLNIDVFRAMNKIGVSEIFRNIFRYSFLFIAVVALFYTKNTTYLVEIFLLNFAFLSVFSTIMVVYYFRENQFRERQLKESISLGKILKRSAPMAVSAASFLLMQSLDVLMLSHFSNYEVVAYYSAAVKLTLLIALVLTSVNAVIAPQIAKDYAQKAIQALKKKIADSTRLIFAITMPGIMLLAFGASFFLGWFGEPYVQAKSSLWVLLVGQTINALCGSIGVYLNMTGKQKVFQVILVSALLVNIVLNYILIPIYGMLGAAIATSSSMILWNLVTVVYIYKKDGIRTFLKL